MATLENLFLLFINIRKQGKLMFQADCFRLVYTELLLCVKVTKGVLGLSYSCYSFQKSAPTTTAKNETNNEYEVVSTVTDRSELSDEMASMCAKLPIYRVKKTTPLSISVKRKCSTLLASVMFRTTKCHSFSHCLKKKTLKTISFQWRLSWKLMSWKYNKFRGNAWCGLDMRQCTCC